MRDLQIDNEESNNDAEVKRAQNTYEVRYIWSGGGGGGGPLDPTLLPWFT